MAKSEKRDGRGGSKSPKGGGESHRHERVEKEIRDVVGNYLLGGFRTELAGLISLTRVRVSGDMKIANFNFTIMLTQDEGETPEAFEKRSVIARRETEKEMNEQARDFQAELAHRLKMRFTPRCQFHYDDGFEAALKVEKVLREMSVAAGRGDELPSTKFTAGSVGDESGSES